MVSSHDVFSGFYPSIPKEEAPNYFGLSKAIEQPKFVSTTGAALSDVGGLVEGAVKGSDEVVKAMVRDRAGEFEPIKEDMVDEVSRLNSAIRNPRLASAEEQPGYVPPGSTQAETAPGASLLPPTQKVPSRVKGVGMQMELLEAAKATGAYTQTQYDAEKLKFLKDIRSQFPTGYRDYIDSEVHKVTDEPIANKYIQSAISDINSFVTNARQEREKIDNQALQASHYSPAIVPLRMGWRAGKVSDGALLTAASQILSNYHSVTYENAKLQNEKMSEDAQARSAEKVATIQLGQKSTDQYAAMIEAEGFKDNPEGFKKALRDNPDKAREVAERIRLSLPGQEQDMWNTLRMPMKVKGYDVPVTFEALLGSDKAKQMVADHMTLPRLWAESLTDEKSGIVYHSTNMAKDTQAAYNNKLLSNPTIAAVANKANFLKSNFGDQATSTQTDLIAQTIAKIDAAANRGFVATQGHLGVNRDPDPYTGRSTSLKEEANRNRTLGGNDPQTFDSLIQQIELIKNTTIPPAVRASYVQRAFSPDNYGLIADLRRDGQIPTFARLTDPAMTASIKALGGKAWDTYKDWAQSTASNELIIPAIQKLNQIQMSPAMEVTYRSGDGSDGKYPSFNYNMGDIKDVLDQPSYKHIARPHDQLFKDINKSIENISYIAKAEGRDVNSYVYNIFRHLGIHEGIAKAMQEAIKNSRPPVKLKEKALP